MMHYDDIKEGSDIWFCCECGAQPQVCHVDKKGKNEGSIHLLEYVHISFNPDEHIRQPRIVLKDDGEPQCHLAKDGKCTYFFGTFTKRPHTNSELFATEKEAWMEWLSYYDFCISNTEKELADAKNMREKFINKFSSGDIPKPEEGST